MRVSKRLTDHIVAGDASSFDRRVICLGKDAVRGERADKSEELVE
jgi:hypothetical protein